MASAQAEDGEVVTYNTIAYQYDTRGNILSKTYSLDGTVVDTVTYAYADTVWKDRLTSFDTTAITYDTIGNPLNWRGGATLTWQHGRQLATFNRGNTAVSYTYNSDGIRTSKTVGGVTTTYTNVDGSLRLMTDGTNTLQFLDSSVLFNGTEYWFVRNAQNDVVGLIDENGIYVVEYTYDAWGNPLSKSGSLTDTLGTLNPYRYRGYIYDEETGLYYCESRYYDPVVGRWLNVDSVIAGIGGDVRGYNLFSCCFNNPLSYIDPYGTCPYDGTMCDFRRLEQGLPPRNCTCNQEPKTILLSKKATNRPDSGLRDVTDEEIQKRARDRSLSGKERKRYQEEEKVRGLRNKQKRNSNFSLEPVLDVACGVGIVSIATLSVVVIAADDITGVGAANDILLVPLAELYRQGAILIFS